VAGFEPELANELLLRSTVPFAKGVNRVYFAEIMAGAHREVVCGEPA